MKTLIQGPLRNRSAWDLLVNERFGGERPVLSPEESILAARRLYRHAMGKAFDGEIKLTSGNRNTWVRRGVMSVNPNHRGRGGLREIIHGISHYAHSRLHPKDAPHSSRQVHLEGELVEYALSHGFLDGSLKRLKREPVAPEAKPDKVQLKYARMVKRRDRWMAEAERAKRLLAKAAKEVREYERRHKERLEVKP